MAVELDMIDDFEPSIEVEIKDVLSIDMGALIVVYADSNSPQSMEEVYEEKANHKYVGIYQGLTEPTSPSQFLWFLRTDEIDEKVNDVIELLNNEVETRKEKDKIFSDELEELEVKVNEDLENKPYSKSNIIQKSIRICEENQELINEILDTYDTVYLDFGTMDPTNGIVYGIFSNEDFSISITNTDDGSDMWEGQEYLFSSIEVYNNGEVKKYLNSDYYTHRDAGGYPRFENSESGWYTSDFIPCSKPEPILINCHNDYEVDQIKELQGSINNEFFIVYEEKESITLKEKLMSYIEAGDNINIEPNEDGTKLIITATTQKKYLHNVIITNTANTLTISIINNSPEPLKPYQKLLAYFEEKEIKDYYNRILCNGITQSTSNETLFISSCFKTGTGLTCYGMNSLRDHKTYTLNLSGSSISIEDKVIEL